MGMRRLLSCASATGRMGRWGDGPGHRLSRSIDIRLSQPRNQNWGKKKKKSETRSLAPKISQRRPFLQFFQFEELLTIHAAAAAAAALLFSPAIGNGVKNLNKMRMQKRT